ncbi:MAG: hypothetical protein HY758_03480 [Nitrospirae bacterium]|nr:hypothetical protein [Nitrospirota bacterium]
MFGKVLFQISLMVFLLVTACARTDDKQPQAAPEFKQIAEVEDIKPDKPARIKLKRNAKDDYSWEISGDKVEDIIKADKKLREDLKTQ